MDEVATQVEILFLDEAADDVVHWFGCEDVFDRFEEDIGILVSQLTEEVQLECAELYSF